ncbi:MAG: hypothetical protein ACLPZR_07385 [Solirubrobacteraceae bacterium]
MSDTTLEKPSVLQSTGRGRRRSRPRSLGFLARHIWWLVAFGVVAISLLIVVTADARPGYDPYGWLGWGYQTLHGSLNLGGAPSWKPFTYVFTVPYALFGHYELWLWMVTAVAISLSGGIFGGRIAYRVVAQDAQPRWPAFVAAVFAGVSVLAIQAYFHYLLSDQSDPMLVSVCLAAIDCYLGRRLAWAWWLGVLAGLGRPEVWPFIVAYGIWLIVKRPNLRWMIGLAAIITLFLWFGVPTITNGKPDIAGQLALKSPRELHSNRIVGTIDRFTALDYLGIELAALAAVALAFLKRNVTVLALAGMTVAWVVIEIAFVLHGFPGVPRYLFEPAGLTGVLAGIAVGWLLLDLSRLHPRIPSWAGVPVVAVLGALTIGHVVRVANAESTDLIAQHARTTEIDKLASAIHSLGGPKRILACGAPILNVEYVSIMGWYLHMNTGDIGYRPLVQLLNPGPMVLFTSFPNGWAITPYHVTSSACAHLQSYYVPTRHHPHGVLVPKYGTPVPAIPGS